LLSFTLGLLLMLGSSGLSAQAQFSLPSTSQNGQKPPSGVERIGLLEVTSVYFNGESIFKIASPAVFNRDAPNNQIPVEVRARDIEANLKRLLAEDRDRKPTDKRRYSTFLDPDTVQVVKETINMQSVLLVKDANLSQPETLLTVTDSDARYYYTSIEEVADRWQKILEREFRVALAMRQPAALKEQIGSALTTILQLVLITLGLFGLWKILSWHKHRLEHQQTLQLEQNQAAIAVPVDNIESDPISTEIVVSRQRVSRLRLQLVGLLRWLLFWATAFLWLFGIGMILRLFPATRRYADFTSAPVLILVGWFLAGLLDRLADLLIDRFTNAWKQGDWIITELNEHVDGHRDRRISTIVSAIKWLKTALIYSFAVLLMLQVLGVSTGSVLAIGAVVALAVSFASQSLVKDLVNGFLILLEDQYAVGDVVAVGSATGFVENMNLRITQLRSSEGRLITIPNSQISQVENLTRNWSRVNFGVEVAYETDVDKALSVVQEVAQELYDDPPWRSLIPEKPEVLGVDSITHQGLLIRVWIKTTPLQQWKVEREFRRRLKVAFDRQGIHIGVPQQAMYGTNGLAILESEDPVKAKE
jgi:small conductance mechanosensitive channel